MLQTHHGLVLCLILSISLCISEAPRAEAFPYRLEIEAWYGEPRGPQSMLDDVTSELVRDLDSRRCYAGIEPAGREGSGEGEFRLTMTFHDFEEQVEYLATIAQRSRAANPEVGQRLVARIEVVAHLQLVYLPERLVVRSTRTSIRQHAMPVMPGQDDLFARDEARRTAVEQLVYDAAKFVCRGTPGKLEKQLAKARSRAAVSRRAR